MNLGSFNSFGEVWVKYPNGGIEGDTVTVGGTVYSWNKYERAWSGEVQESNPTYREHVTFEGDVTVLNNVTISGTLRAHDLIPQGVGLFGTLSALKAEHPDPRVGMYALVGNSSTPTIYRCETDGTWTDTGLYADVGYQGSTGGTTVLDRLDSASSTYALSANQGRVLNEKIEDVKAKYVTSETLNSTLAGYQPSISMEVFLNKDTDFCYVSGVKEITSSNSESVLPPSTVANTTLCINRTTGHVVLQNTAGGLFKVFNSNMTNSKPSTWFYRTGMSIATDSGNIWVCNGGGVFVKVSNSEDASEAMSQANDALSYAQALSDRIPRVFSEIRCVYGATLQYQSIMNSPGEVVMLGDYGMLALAYDDGSGMKYFGNWTEECDTKNGLQGSGYNREGNEVHCTDNSVWKFISGTAQKWANISQKLYVKSPRIALIEYAKKVFSAEYEEEFEHAGWAGAMLIDDFTSTLYRYFYIFLSYSQGYIIKHDKTNGTYSWLNKLVIDDGIGGNVAYKKVNKQNSGGWLDKGGEHERLIVARCSSDTTDAECQQFLMYSREVSDTQIDTLGTLTYTGSRLDAGITRDCTVDAEGKYLWIHGYVPGSENAKEGRTRMLRVLASKITGVLSNELTDDDVDGMIEFFVPEAAQDIHVEKGLVFYPYGGPSLCGLAIIDSMSGDILQDINLTEIGKTFIDSPEPEGVAVSDGKLYINFHHSGTNSNECCIVEIPLNI